MVLAGLSREKQPAGSPAPLTPGVYDDGTFMSYDDEEQIRAEQCERVARGG